MREGWESRSLGDVCEFVRGPFGGSLTKSCFRSSGFAVYEQQHAIYNQFNDIRYFIDEEKFREMQRFELRPGDLIMSCSGTMGKAAIAPEGIGPGIINQALLKLRPRKDISVEFLKLWMDSPKISGCAYAPFQGRRDKKRRFGKNSKGNSNSASAVSRTATHCCHSERGVCGAGDRDR